MSRVSDKGCANTEIEIWRGESGLQSDPDNFYADSVSVDSESIIIKSAGYCVGMSTRKWVGMARELRAARDLIRAASKVDSCHRQNQKLELVDALQNLTKALAAYDATEEEG